MVNNSKKYVPIPYGLGSTKYSYRAKVHLVSLGCLDQLWTIVGRFDL